MSMYVLAINEFALIIFKNKIIVPCLLVKYGPKKKKKKTYDPTPYFDYHMNAEQQIYY